MEEKIIPHFIADDPCAEVDLGYEYFLSDAGQFMSMIQAIARVSYALKPSSFIRDLNKVLSDV